MYYKQKQSALDLLEAERRQCPSGGPAATEMLHFRGIYILPPTRDERSIWAAGKLEYISCKKQKFHVMQVNNTNAQTAPNKSSIFGTPQSEHEGGGAVCEPGASTP